ncbi:hypothetical protein B0H16DRAFT_1479244 [Mycena metata]|uniref:Uncharacterized protein n=1 Tax=Mycena metata TaxID=1033252 RepID=A0AAD7H563_9AGAR|nr:hypothetical protein B0H16DRAFT_1479244 [Mycena metata]
MDLSAASRQASVISVSSGSSSSPSDTSGSLELLYLPESSITFDLLRSVRLIVWMYDLGPTCITVYPRDVGDGFSRLVLNDYLQSLLAIGFDTNIPGEVYLEFKESWTPFGWNITLPVTRNNQLMFIRSNGACLGNLLKSHKYGHPSYISLNLFTPIIPTRKRKRDLADTIDASTHVPIRNAAMKKVHFTVTSDTGTLHASHVLARAPASPKPHTVVSDASSELPESDEPQDGKEGKTEGKRTQNGQLLDDFADHLDALGNLLLECGADEDCDLPCTCRDEFVDMDGAKKPMKRSTIFSLYQPRLPKMPRAKKIVPENIPKSPEGWLWHLGKLTKMSTAEMNEWANEGDLVQWFRAEAEMQRWQEQSEQKLVELLRTPSGRYGAAAYARQKAAMYEKRTEEARTKVKELGYGSLLGKGANVVALIDSQRRLEAEPRSQMLTVGDLESVSSSE